MKPQEIKVGKTYINRGAGTTRRKVLGIGNEHRPKVWHGNGITSPPDEPGVSFEQYSDRKGHVKAGKACQLYLSSFAAWAGAEV